MSYLLVGDLHLTDRPRDAYRFDIFKWMKWFYRNYAISAIILMGDLTDQKDRHDSTLVNRVVEELIGLPGETYIVMGNHDYIDPDTPYFRFLNHFSNVKFITKPVVYGRLAFIPHCREEADFRAACEGLSGNKVDYLFVHQTFEGARAETGKRLAGFSTSPIDYLKPAYGTYAGDVHKPQTQGPVTYVGAPYTIRFGDDFEPRCILLRDDGTPRNVYFQCPRKWRLTVKDEKAILKDARLLVGDQVKITIQIAREDIVDWKLHRQRVLDACHKQGLEVFGIDFTTDTVVSRETMAKANGRTNDEILTAYCKAEGLPEPVTKAGLGMLSV